MLYTIFGYFTHLIEYSMYNMHSLAFPAQFPYTGIESEVPAMAGFTKIALQQTLLALLRTTPLDKITVRMIADTCGVSRNTFYYHYEGLPELLRDTLETELRQISRSESDDPDWRAKRLLTYIADNRIIFDRIFRSDYRDLLHADLLASISAIALADIDACGGCTDPGLREAIATFFANGLLSLCSQWLEHGAKEPPEALLQRLALFDGLLEEAVARANQRPLP